MMSAQAGSWTDPAATFAYAWQRCDGTGVCTSIDGAVGSTYTLTGDDLGWQIRVEVTASNASGSGTADSATVGPVTQPAPAPTTDATTTPAAPPPQAATAQTTPTATPNGGSGP